MGKFLKEGVHTYELKGIEEEEYEYKSYFVAKLKLCNNGNADDGTISYRWLHVSPLYAALVNARSKKCSLLHDIKNDSFINPKLVIEFNAAVEALYSEWVAVDPFYRNERRLFPKDDYLNLDKEIPELLHPEECILWGVDPVFNEV